MSELSLDAIERVVLAGNLEQLTEPQRVDMLLALCKSLDLNPLTRPFAFLPFEGRVQLYALRSATDQLRAKRGISASLGDGKNEGSVYSVRARVWDGTGREDTGSGAVAISKKAADLANAIKTAETQAKRRATLSFCGLGFLDESEVAEMQKRSTAPVEPEVDYEDPFAAEADAAEQPEVSTETPAQGATENPPSVSEEEPPLPFGGSAPAFILRPIPVATAGELREQLQANAPRQARG